MHDFSIIKTNVAKAIWLNANAGTSIGLFMYRIVNL